MTTMELHQLSEGIRQVRTLKSRYSDLKAQRQVLGEKTFTDTSAAIRREHSALVSRLKPLSRQAKAEIRRLETEQQELRNAANAGKTRVYSRKRMEFLNEELTLLRAAAAGTPEPTDPPDRAEIAAGSPPGLLVVSEAGKRRPVVPAVIAALVLVLVATGFLALRVIDNRATTEARRQIEQVLDNLGLERVVRYGSLRVDSIAGRISATDVVIGGGDAPVELRFARVSVSVPPLEAARLVSDPDRAVFSRIGVVVEDADLLDRGSGARLSIGGLRVNAVGRFAVGMASDPSEMLAGINQVGVNLEGSVIRLGDQLEQMLITRFGDRSWITDPNNWEVELLEASVDVDVDSGETAAVTLSSFSMLSPLIRATGVARFELTDALQPRSASARFTVNDLKPEIRDIVVTAFRLIDLVVPRQGTFDVVFEADESGPPVVAIE